VALIGYMRDPAATWLGLVIAAIIASSLELPAEKLELDVYEHPVKLLAGSLALLVGLVGVYAIWVSGSMAHLPSFRDFQEKYFPEDVVETDQAPVVTSTKSQVEAEGTAVEIVQAGVSTSTMPPAELTVEDAAGGTAEPECRNYEEMISPGDIKLYRDDDVDIELGYIKKDDVIYLLPTPSIEAKGEVFVVVCRYRMKQGEEISEKGWVVGTELTPVP